MSLTTHLYRAAHNHPRGMADLAEALSTPDEPVSESSLQKKVNARYPGAHCSPEQAMRIMEHTGDHGYFFAQGRRLGYVSLPLPQLADGVDASTVQLMTSSIKEFGELMTEVAADLANGKVNDNEMDRIEKEGLEAIAAIPQMIAHAQQLNAAGKPSSVRGPVGLKAA